MHTENSVRINQHTCGTLIADIVDALSLLASTSQSEDWKSLPRPVVECIKVLGVRVAKESGFDQQKSCSARSRRSGISTQEGKRRGNRLAEAKRRVADIGGVIPDLWNRYHAPLFRRLLASRGHFPDFEGAFLGNRPGFHISQKYRVRGRDVCRRNRLRPERVPMTIRNAKRMPLSSFTAG